MDCLLFVVARDFGFAPNPFHGVCTLATCKPVVRRVANCGDWIFGIGGGRMKATGRLIFAMEVTESLTFDQYWTEPRFLPKRPVRNGSQKMLVGDNIYRTDPVTGNWVQEDSHHSNADGTANHANLRHDTKTNRVLIGDRFFYFGEKAPVIPAHILDTLGYGNRRGHRRYSQKKCQQLLDWLYDDFGAVQNLVAGDPFEFASGARRYSVDNNKVS